MTIESFRELGIDDAVLKAIEDAGFASPTEIQIKVIPSVLAGKDVIAGSSTGSGKTLAFASGIIGSAVKGEGIQALILTPTRELAEQVSEAFRFFSRYHHLHIASVYGGVSINPQFDSLKRADIVVGTPGRVLDHIERRTISLGKVKTLVLDEADRMLDMGFIDDVERIIRCCPHKRQTLLFSATISRDVMRLSGRYMIDPINISAGVYVDPTKLTQVYYDVAEDLKFSLLLHLIKSATNEFSMVFCNTRRSTDFVAFNLKASGVNAVAIHGGLTQARRNDIMKAFQSRKTSVLVCTDVAARGLDIPSVSHVYNYEIPRDSNDYIHRIGRTARAGREGKVVNLLSSKDYDNFRRVVRDNEIDIPVLEVPEVEKVSVRLRSSSREFGGGKRPHNRSIRGMPPWRRRR